MGAALHDTVTYVAEHIILGRIFIVTQPAHGIGLGVRFFGKLFGAFGAANCTGSFRLAHSRASGLHNGCPSAPFMFGRRQITGGFGMAFTAFAGLFDAFFTVCKIGCPNPRVIY